jgi:hypothetical protein
MQDDYELIEIECRISRHPAPHRNNLRNSAIVVRLRGAEERDSDLNRSPQRVPSESATRVLVIEEENPPIECLVIVSQNFVAFPVILRE